MKTVAPCQPTDRVTTQTWVGGDGIERTEAIKPAAQKFVDAIGVRSAFELIFHLGGSTCYLTSKRTSEFNIVLQTIGPEANALLQQGFRSGQFKVPLCTEFCARYLRASGFSLQAISRKLRVKRDTVARLLSTKTEKATDFSRVMSGSFAGSKLDEIDPEDEVPDDFG